MTGGVKTVEGSEFTGAVKLSMVHMSGRRCIGGYEVSNVYLNGQRIMIINLGKRRVFVKGAEE